MHLLIGKIIKDKFLIAYRARLSAATPVLFFIVVVVLFPLTISTNPVLLQQMAPGIIWVTVALSVLLNATYLFYEDYVDGSLERLILSPHPFSLLLLAELIAHWLITLFPLIILTPLVAMSLHISPQSIKLLILSLLLGTPVLSFLGALGAALTLGLPQGGLLLAVLMLPLYVPVLIFGVHAALLLLLAMLILALGLLPLAIATALRIAVE